MSTARSAGIPAAAVKVHVPPLFSLRQIRPLSPTITTRNPRATTPRSGRLPRFANVHAAPPLNER
jgi:hypothetical protein